MNPLEILKIIILIVLLAITVYVFYENKRWVKLSQGIKPLLFGISLLLASGFIYYLEQNENIVSIIRVLIFLGPIKYSVGITKLIFVSYVVMLYGLEVSLMVLIKQLKRKRNY